MSRHPVGFSIMVSGFNEFCSLSQKKQKTKQNARQAFFKTWDCPRRQPMLRSHAVLLAAVHLQDQDWGCLCGCTPCLPLLLQENMSWLLGAWLRFLATSLFLLPTFVRPGSLVNKNGCRLFSHCCFHMPGLAVNLQGTAVHSAVFGYGEKEWVQEEELLLSSHADEGIDADRHSCVIPFCRSQWFC